jgi:DNA-binding IclR family transcriptional regulator
LAPAHCTSLGKALLALMTDEQVAKLYPTSAEPFPARTDRSITTQARLLKEVGKARTRGYAVNSGETEEDVGSVAVAFRDFAGRPAAIAVAAPSSRLSAQRISRIGELMIDAISRTPMSPGAAHAPAD